MQNNIETLKIGYIELGLVLFKKNKIFNRKIYFEVANGKPEVLVHYVVLIGYHSIVRIIYLRWRCVSLVTERPLSLLLHMTYQLLLSMT